MVARSKRNPSKSKDQMTKYEDVFGNDKPVEDVLDAVNKMDRKAHKAFYRKVIYEIRMADDGIETTDPKIKQIVEAHEARKAELDRLERIGNARKAANNLRKIGKIKTSDDGGDDMSRSSGDFSWTALIFGCLVPLFRLDWISFWTTFVLTGIFMLVLVWGWSGLAYFGGPGTTADNIVAGISTLPMLIMHVFLGLKYNEMHEDFG